MAHQQEQQLQNLQQDLSLLLLNGDKNRIRSTSSGEKAEAVSPTSFSFSWGDFPSISDASPFYVAPELEERSNFYRRPRSRVITEHDISPPDLVDANSDCSSLDDLSSTDNSIPEEHETAKRISSPEESSSAKHKVLFTTVRIQEYMKPALHWGRTESVEEYEETVHWRQCPSREMSIDEYEAERLQKAMAALQPVAKPLSRSPTSSNLAPLINNAEAYYDEKDQEDDESDEQFPLKSIYIQFDWTEALRQCDESKMHPSQLHLREGYFLELETLDGES